MGGLQTEGAGVRSRDDADNGGGVASTRRLRVLLLLGLVCSNLLVFALAGHTLYQSHRQHELLAETMTANVAGAIEQNLSNSISRIDLSLRAAADELEQQLAGRGIDAPAMAAFLARLQERLPEVESFRVADASGLVFLGKGVDPAARASWADRDYFAYHRANDDGVVRISPPRVGRVARQHIVGFSLRYNGPDGRFAGVISAPIAVESLSRAISGYDIGLHGTIVLRYADAGLIARVPPLPEKPVGQIGNASISPELRRIVDAGVRQASYFTPASADGYRRIVSFRRLANAPLMFVVGMASEDYLAAWEVEAYKTGAMACGFLLLSLVLGGLSLRMIRLAERREAELVGYRRHLEDLVDERTRALVEQEAQASHILRSSADGLYGIDHAGSIVFINPSACAILGYTEAEAIGQSAHALFHHSHPDGSPYPADACPALGALREGHEVRVDNEVYWHADGHPVPVMYAAHPIVRDGHIAGCVTSFVDMSAQRAAAAAREEALLAAEHLARVRREFLANMSHEIRTPLNGVLGFADIGYRNYDKPEKARNAFGKILASGQRLLGVINDVLDFSKIEAGKFAIEEVRTHLAEVVARAVELEHERAKAKGLTIDVELAPDLPPVCISDPLRMGQVLLNLLSNAIKFTDAGRVSVSVRKAHGMLCFAVRDTGIGMSETLIRDLFSPFQQADASAARRFGGTGLGLAISKRILELMGGDVHVDSRVGEGSTFEFRLPCRLPDDEETAGPAAAPARGTGLLAGLSVLVVEDDPVNQAMLEENLVADGAGVVVVASGTEALTCVRDCGALAFDLVLMDLQLPGMDGYETTRQLHGLAPDLPVVAQSAHAFCEERERCFAVGMVAHIAKPIDPEELVRAVLAHARGGRINAAARSA